MSFFFFMRKRIWHQDYTGWPKSHATKKKIEYLCYGSRKRADFFTTNKGMLALHTYKGKARDNRF
jgi:hypothetical protein